MFTLGAKSQDDEPRVIGFPSVDLILLPLYSAIFVYAAFFSILRPLGTPLLLAVMFSILSIFILIRGRYMNLWLLFYAAIAAVFVVLSYSVDLYTGVTAMYIPAAIPQQSAYAFVLVITVPVFSYFIEQLQAERRAYVLLERGLFLLCIIAILWTELASSRPGVPVFAIGTLTNVHVFVLFILYRNLSEFLRTSTGVWVFGALLVPVIAASLQSLLVAAYYMVLAGVGRLRIVVVLSSIALLLLVPFVLSQFGDEIYRIDANTGVRAWIWEIVFDRVAQTNFVGVGFGTELVPPYFLVDGSQFVLRATSSDSFVHIGAHNAILDTYYRMGLAGVGIILLYLGRLIGTFLGRHHWRDLFGYWVVFTLVLTLSVNVALVSYNFFFGTCLLLAWLTVSNRTGTTR